MKKILNYLLLCFLLLQSMLPSSALAASSSYIESEQILTIEWLSEKYNISQNELLNELNKGYSIQNLLSALQKESNRPLDEVLEQMYPEILEKLKKQDYSIKSSSQEDDLLQSAEQFKPSVTESTYVTNTGTTSITSDKFTYEQILGSQVTSSVYSNVYGLKGIKALSASPITNFPTTYDDFAVKRLNMKADAPYSVGGNENVSLMDGSLTLSNVDMTLPGRNGLSFSLNRRYNSSEATYYDKDVFSDNVFSVAYYPKLSSRLYFKYSGEKITQYGSASDFYFEPYYYSWFYHSFVQYMGQYTYWDYPTSYSPIEDFNNENRRLLENAWGYTDPDNPNSLPIFANENINLSGVPLMAKAFTTGTVLEYPNSKTPVCLQKDYYGNCSNYKYAFANKVKGREVQENRFPIGKGWSWDISFIETKDNNKKFISLMGGGTYELDGVNLKGYPWKDLTLSYNSTVTVNNIPSYYVLSSINGQRQYFSYDGKLIQISDAYNNTIQFEYANVTPYGVVLTKIKDAIQNEINITYSTTEVTITQGSRTIKYSKIKDPQGNKELLSQVTDPAGRKTSYVYDIATVPFDLVGYGRMMDNYTALLKQVLHPTKARTEYTYTPYTRSLGPSAKENVYRVTAREDSISYEGKPDEKSNHVDYSYIGDGGANQKSTYSFSTSLNDGLKTTKYTFKKQYINDDTPDMVYNTEILQQAGVTQKLTKQTFDEARKLPEPIEVSTTTSNGTTTSQPLIMKRTYDDYKNVLTETSPLNVITTFVYDATSHLLSTVLHPIDADKSSYSELIRNEQGSIVQATVKENTSSGALKQQINNAYDPYGNSISRTIRDDNRNIVINQEYGILYNAGFMTKQSVNVTDANGIVTTIDKKAEYNKSTGALTKLIDAKGNEISYEYDPLGRVIKETLPDLNQTLIVYDDNNNGVAVTDVAGLTTHQQYNPLGQETKVTQGQNFTTFGYDAYGRRTWSEDAKGQRTQSVYDAWGRSTQVIYPDGFGDSVEYNDINQTMVSTDAEGNQFRETYDIMGRLLKKEQLKPTGTNILNSYTYDYVGNPLTITDGNNNTTAQQYDVLGRLVAIVDPQLNKTNYTYSLGGNLTEIHYADGNKLIKQFDELGKIIKRTDSSGLTDSYFYDVNGNMIRQVDRKGQTTTLAYDPKRDYLNMSKTSNETVTYTYNAAGQRLSMTDSTGTTSYLYDLTTGYLTKLTYPDGRTIQYQYDVLGNQEQMTDPFGLVTKYSYDTRNRLAGVKSATDQEVALYSYKKNNRLASVIHANALVWTYTYDGINLAGLTQKRLTGSEVNSFSYGYDANFNQISKTENGVSSTFAYDQLNRVDASSQFNEQYKYDTRGNRQALQSSKDINFIGTSYAYDDRNRLTEVSTDDGKYVSYRYNGDGLLYERTENGVTTRYYYDSGNMIAEGTVVANGTAALKASYVRGNGLVAREDASGNKQYYQTNGHGDVVGLTDSAGNTLNAYSYDMWGNPITTSESVEQPFRYSGEFWDSAANMQYLRARWYDPSVGRFISEDPHEGQVVNPLSLNLYTYVENNPLRYVDRTGNAKEETGLGGGAGGRASGGIGGGGGSSSGGTVSNSGAASSSGITFEQLEAEVAAITRQRYQDYKESVGTRTPSLSNSNLKGINVNTDGSVTVTMRTKVGEDIRVNYNKQGYPDFSPYKWNGAGKAEVKIDYTGNRAKDFQAANKEAGFTSTPNGYTWHHMEDTQTMTLIRTDVHDAFPHTGGFSLFNSIQ